MNLTNKSIQICYNVYVHYISFLSVHVLMTYDIITYTCSGMCQINYFYFIFMLLDILKLPLPIHSNKYYLIKLFILHAELYCY